MRPEELEDARRTLMEYHSFLFRNVDQNLTAYHKLLGKEIGEHKHAVELLIKEVDREGPEKRILRDRLNYVTETGEKLRKKLKAEAKEYMRINQKHIASLFQEAERELE